MDKSDFTGRVTACQAKLYHIAHAILGSTTDAEDAVQDALLNAWRAHERLRDERVFETWLIRILINVCRAQLSTKAMRKYSQLSDNLPEPEVSDVGLREALYRLDEKYRLPLVLHCAEDYEVAQIAAILRIPIGAVKWRIHQGRLKLKRILEEEGADA